MIAERHESGEEYPILKDRNFTETYTGVESLIER